MKVQRFIFAFFYLCFTLLVNTHANGACAEVEPQNHNCCCSASGGCDEDMSCCVGESEDDSPEYVHALNSPVEVQKLFLEEIVTNFSTIEICVKGVDFAMKSNPPPREKVYLTIHQLIFYA